VKERQEELRPEIRDAVSQSMVAGVNNMKVGGYEGCFGVEALETPETFGLASCTTPMGTNRGKCRIERKKDDDG
jgi:hypothetical protein